MSSKQPLGKPLTTQLIFTKAKSDSLPNIKNLNLWGNDLQDLSLIQKMPNLQVISLSVNRISSLKYFAGCTKLQELYLRKNNIVDLREIKYLLKLPIKVLWLYDNPCAQVENYRLIVIKYLNNLAKLDNNPITNQQLIASKSVNYSLGVNQDNYKSQAYNTPQGQHYPSSHQQQHHHQQSHSIQQKYTAPPQSQQRPMTGQQNRQPPSTLYQQKNFSQQQNYPSYQQPQYQKYPQINQSSSKKSQQNQQKKPYSGGMQNQINDAENTMNRNQNILMAILSLMRQLDGGSLEIVRRQADKMLEGD